MSTGAAGVRSFVEELPNDGIFARKHLVGKFGTRGVVDNVLRRLCSEHKIARVATGIYQKRTGASRLPTAREIIELRASAFGKQIIEPVDGDASCTTFLTDGCRSSFRSIHGRLYFKPVRNSSVRPRRRPAEIASVVTIASYQASKPRLPSWFGVVRDWFLGIKASF